MRKSRGIRASLLPVTLAVAMAGCGDPESPIPVAPDGRLFGAVVREGIEYRADVAVLESFPAQLSGRATVTNRSGGPRTVTFTNGCLAQMRVYRAEGGDPVWDQARETGCTMALVPLDLDPGEESIIPTGIVSARDILGEDLPDGSYGIAVYLRLADDDGVVEIEVEAGVTELAIPR